MNLTNVLDVSVESNFRETTAAEVVKGKTWHELAGFLDEVLDTRIIGIEMLLHGIGEEKINY